MMSRLWRCVLVGGPETGSVIHVKTSEQDSEPQDLQVHGETFSAREVNLLTPIGRVVNDDDEHVAIGTALMYRREYTADEENRARQVFDAL